MKKLVPLFTLVCLAAVSCWRHDHDLTISYNEADGYYTMDAHFSKSKTKAVEKYMDMSLGKQTNMSFINSRMDGNIALDDHTTFYIEKYPGHIKIKMDIDENSYESYEKVRDMCEGMKEVLEPEKY